MQVIFNGQLFDAEDPHIRISPFSTAVQFGNSVFESMRTYNRQPPSEIESHWERLFQSAQTLKIELPSTLTQSTLNESLYLLLSQLDLSQEYRLKVLANTEFWWITAHNLVLPPASVYQAGVKVSEAIEVRELSRAKCASPLYPYYQKINQEQGVFETLYFSPDGYLLEGSISSVIAVINGVLRTPQHQVLPGVTVRQVLRYALEQGLSTDIGTITKKELQQASEILLTNAVKGLIPVSNWKNWERSSTKVYDQLKMQFQAL